MYDHLAASSRSAGRRARQLIASPPRRRPRGLATPPRRRAVGDLPRLAVVSACGPSGQSHPDLTPVPVAHQDVAARAVSASPGSSEHLHGPPGARKHSVLRERPGRCAAAPPRAQPPYLFGSPVRPAASLTSRAPRSRTSRAAPRSRPASSLDKPARARREHSPAASGRSHGRAAGSRRPGATARVWRRRPVQPRMCGRDRPERHGDVTRGSPREGSPPSTVASSTMPFPDSTPTTREHPTHPAPHRPSRRVAGPVSKRLGRRGSSARRRAVVTARPPNPRSPKCTSSCAPGLGPAGAGLGREVGAPDPPGVAYPFRPPGRVSTVSQVETGAVPRVTHSRPRPARPGSARGAVLDCVRVLRCPRRASWAVGTTPNPRTLAPRGAG